MNSGWTRLTRFGRESKTGGTGGTSMKRKTIIAQQRREILPEECDELERLKLRSHELKKRVEQIDREITRMEQDWYGFVVEALRTAYAEEAKSAGTVPDNFPNQLDVYTGIGEDRLPYIQEQGHRGPEGPNPTLRH